MLLASLVDAGCPLEVVEDAARRCGVDARLRVAEVLRSGLRGLHLTVEADPDAPERRLAAMVAAVDGAGLADAVRDGARATLLRLGACEARLHGVDLADVHLHELSGADTMVDIVGFWAALDHLGVEEVRCGPLPAAPGTVVGAHGSLPLPAPAVLELLAEAGAPLVPGIPGVEQVTPTAAALLASAARFEPPLLRLRRVGHGAGTRELPGRPNLVRCWLGDPIAGGQSDTAGGAAMAAAPAGATGDRGTGPETELCVELRVNLDDTAPAVVAALAARCLEAGALDAWIVAATMKKGRPGSVLHALVAAGAEAALARLLLAEAPTLGVRMTPAARLVAGRDVVTLATARGPVRVKRKWLGGRAVDARPELDDVAAAAAVAGEPLHLVLDELTAAAREALVAPPGAAPASPPPQGAAPGHDP